MSLPNWFYPIVMLWLVAIPGIDPHPQQVSGKKNAWLTLIDMLFLLPWILTLAFDEPLAAWVGLEVLSLVLLFDILGTKPTEKGREAWIKLTLSWFLSWLLIGTAVALSGVHPIVENLFYPLPTPDIDRIRPVLSGVMLLLGLCLKLGLPPFQQGLIDMMDVLDAESHRRWALPLRWAIAYAAWQLLPSVLGALSPFNQQMFAVMLLLGCLVSCMVASVQAGVQRTLSYMGSFLILPPLLSFLIIDPRLGMNAEQTLGIWLFTAIGFIMWGRLYQAWPLVTRVDTQSLIWTDDDAPCSQPGWFGRWRQWMLWSVFVCLSLATLAFSQMRWLLGFLLVALAVAAASASSKQLGIKRWQEEQQKN